MLRAELLRNVRTNRGLMVSAGAHAALLAATLVAFSRTPPYEDALETVPVEIVTDSTLNQIMKGDKTAKAVKPTPKVDKVADHFEAKPLPPTPDAKKDVPTPPPPLKRLADPGEDEKPEQKEPQKVAALPPPRPVPDPPKVEPTPPARPQPVKAVEEKPDPQDAEPVRPKPVERPKDIAREQPKEPPKEQPKEPPKPVPAPPKPQLRIDEVAKLLEKARPDPKPKADKPAAKPKSGEDEPDPRPSLDLSAISKLIDHDKPARMAATGAQLQQTASLGAPDASATKMSPTMLASLMGLIGEQYQRCWNQNGTTHENGYIPLVKVQLRIDGGLAATPVLLNPASDGDSRALGEAALRAVRACDPLRIPPQYAPYYAQWKSPPTLRMKTEQ